ncbi:MAG: OmpA family protein [Magnetococcales bacterium]|nr:OmpA family protein [Magnetococcales bacterium]
MKSVFWRVPALLLSPLLIVACNQKIPPAGPESSLAAQPGQCQGSAQAVPLGALCAGDADLDLVADAQDHCPETPWGVPVLKNGCPMDPDGDGVLDHTEDRCPGTLPGLTVDARGCPEDGDLDGVVDRLDRCPGTPRGAVVNREGCWTLDGLHFDTAKWDIQPQYALLLDSVALIVKNNPGVHIEIHGHTDARGAPEFNQKLSEKRAGAVLTHLVARGIPASRLSAHGHGLGQPVASNDTDEGRAVNRRVELKPRP